MKTTVATAGSGYRNLVDGLAVLPDAGRTLIEIRGPRAHRIVSGLVTNSLEPVAAGEARYAFLLTAKGRPIADLRLLPGVPIREAESVRLDVAPVCRDTVLRYFARTIPPIFATFEELDAGLVSLVGEEDRVREALLEFGVEDGSVRLPPSPLQAVETQIHGCGTVMLVGREAAEGRGVDVYVAGNALATARERIESAVRRAGGGVAGDDDWETFRIELGLPVYGPDIGPDNLPQETGQTERAISFGKGCYTGQEVVARLHYRGHVNRLLRGIRASGPEAPAPSTAEEESRSPRQAELAPGVELHAGGRPVGRITSAAVSPRLGPIALGYVRTTVEPGEPVAVGDAEGPSARVVELPFTFK